MRKSILSLGGFIAGALTLANAQAVLAQSTLATTVSQTEAAVSLVMPFDATTGKQSFELVSRKGNPASVVATHWSFWSDSCDHLGDVFICLTDNDTVVVDPTSVQSQVQKGGKNNLLGPVLNFSGSRGFITVSSFDADTSADTCIPADRTSLSEFASLVGSWVVASTTTNAAFGNNALGFLDAPGADTAQALPNPDEFFNNTTGLQLQFFNPDDLKDSEVYVIGIGSPNGNGEFTKIEIGPIPAQLANGAAMCCQAEYFDNIETDISIPDLCFTCASFTAITEKLAPKDGGFLIPDLKAPHTSGFLSLTNCTAGNADGTTVNLNVQATNTNGGVIVNAAGDDVAIFPFAFHGMAVGPFGTSVSGKYTDFNNIGMSL